MPDSSTMSVIEGEEKDDLTSTYSASSIVIAAALKHLCGGAIG